MLLYLKDKNEFINLDHVANALQERGEPPTVNFYFERGGYIQAECTLEDFIIAYLDAIWGEAEMMKLEQGKFYHG